MNKTKLVNGLIVLSTLIAGSAFADMHFTNNSKIKAGGLVGNGGGTVVCRNADQSIKSVELLDYYESMLHPGMQIDIQTIPGDWKAKATAIVNRIRTKSELHYQIYSRWLASFESELQVLDGVSMSTVPDSGYIAVPKGCEFEQAAIQLKPNFAGDYRYHFNGEIWRAMDDSQKAGLVLHEMIYREAIAYGHTDSIRARYLSGLYASTEFQNMSFTDYVSILDQAHFELIDVPVNSALQGKVVSYFDPTRLWLSGPGDQTMPTTIDIQDKYVARLGQCSAPDCNSFNSYRLMSKVLSGATRDQGIALPGDLVRLKIDNSIVGGISIYSFPVSLPAGMGLEGSRLTEYFGQGSDMAVDITATPVLDGPNANEPYGFGATNTDGWAAMGVSMMLFAQNANHHLEWMSLFSESLYSPDAIKKKTGFAFAIQKCAVINSSFRNGTVTQIGLSGDPWLCGNNFQPGSTIEMNDFFANGNAEIGFSTTNNSGITFNSDHPGQPDPTNDDQWSASSATTAVRCDPSAQQNCLIVNASANRIANSLTLYAQSEASFCPTREALSPSTSCEPFEMELKASQEVPLYANGSLKSFVIGGTTTVTIPATAIDPALVIMPGSLVTLNDQGFIVSVK